MRRRRVCPSPRGSRSQWHESAIASSRPAQRVDATRCWLPHPGCPRASGVRHGVAAARSSCCCRPRAEAERADEGGRLPARLERGRHAHRRGADRRAGPRCRRARLGGRRPLRAARADRRRRARRRRAPLLAVQVLRPAPRARVRPRGAAPLVAPYKVRPAADEPAGSRFETGTLAHELLAGFVAAVEYLHELGWDAIRAHERALGRALPRRAAGAVHALRAADDGGARADLRLPGRRAARRARSPSGSPSGRSPSGTATTTRSR